VFAATFDEQAARRGAAPFLAHQDRVLSWAESRDVVARTATMLSREGVEPGAKVILAAGNSPLFVHLWFALRWLGAVQVPLHSQSTATGIQQVIEDCGATHAVGDHAGMERVTAAGALDASRVIGFEDSGALERLVADLDPRSPAQTPHTALSSILYTSGTTGRPKGVLLSDQCVIAAGRRLSEALGVTEDDRVLLALPLFHTNPQVYGIMVALATGCAIALIDRFDGATFMEDAVRLEATGFTYIGTLLSRLVTRGTPIDGHKVRFCWGGGTSAPVWKEVEERFGIAVHEMYGMTETGGWVTANRADAPRRGSCGTVRPDMTMVIADDDDNPLPPGEVGQILVRNEIPSVLLDGYHNRPELTLAKFRNLWWHTGDAGRVDEDGYLYFLGRQDDVIRRGGENVSPADVEQVLIQHPLVDEVAVVGIPDPDLGQEIKAVVVPLPGFEPASLLPLCEELLPRLAWPRYVAQRSSLPKTATHKVQAGELRQRAGDEFDLRAFARERARG
jgi:acyl-CoA synthetase (AMP-forming)/AMP-acid ligase II